MGDRRRQEEVNRCRPEKMGMELDAGGPVARQRKMPSVRFVEKATGMSGRWLKDLVMSISVANALNCANQFSIKRSVEEERERYERPRDWWCRCRCSSANDDDSDDDDE